MSVFTIVKCDGNKCHTEITFDYGYFDMGDLPDINWSHDADNEFYYCPSCVEKMIKSGELSEYE